MATGWPSLPDVRSWLRLQPDPTQDAVIDDCRNAAIDYAVQRFTVRSYVTNPDGTVSVVYVPQWDVDAGTVPDAIWQGCRMHAGKIYRRRDSVDGTIGFGDAGAIRVGRFDADVEALYGQYSPVVFG
jgi:hypothetical protein